MTATTEIRMVLAGLGGQGVIFLTRLLARAALSLGLPVMVSETHGMSQRGGSVLSHFRIGEGQAPLIRRGSADMVLALELNEAVRNAPFLRPGGRLLVNSEEPLPEALLEPLDALGITVQLAQADRLAQQLGSAGVANVIMAGYAAATPAFPLPIEALRQVAGGNSSAAGSSAAAASPRHRLNLLALQAGYDAGRS